MNEAVELAHTKGILTAASLMVTAPAAADAAARAHRLPRLGVGLHIVLVDGKPMLSPAQIPALVGPDGQFHPSMIRTAFAIALSPKARAQMRAEVGAQFAAFAATGLPLDHVNAHKHFHLHPMIASAIIAAGKPHGLAAARLPYEADSPWLLRWWAGVLGRRLRRAGLFTNSRVAGLAASGAFSKTRMIAAIGALEGGVTEIYCHPATKDAYPGSAPGYRYREELAALLDPEVRAGLVASGAVTGSFAQCAAPHQAASLAA